MAKSQGDKIDELSTLVATLTERVDHVLHQVEQLEGVLVRVALLQHQVDELRSGSKEWANRIWTAGIVYCFGWKK
jgi:hypothetical protein